MKQSDLEEIEVINKMSQIEMARLWRFAPPEHRYFDRTKPFFKAFNERFKELGGFTPKISRLMGW